MNRRSEIDHEVCDLKYLHKIMLSLFPKKNDFGTKDELEEVLEELAIFGFISKLSIRLLLKRYRRLILNGEKEPLDNVHKEIYREMMGEEHFLDSLRRQYWLAYPAMIRFALGEEFGEKYEAFSNKRDHID